MFDPEDAPAPGDTSSQDASKPGFQKAWNAWTSKPENNAALLQFGISMLQPRAPGQSGIGSIANAIGDAGGAAGRVQETQRAEDLQEANIADREAQRENQASLAASKNIEANAYDYAARNKTPVGGGGLSGLLRVQQDFRKWLVKPEDTTGMSVDPIVGAISKTFPHIKTKADLLNDQAAMAAARRLFEAQMTTEPSDTGEALGAGSAAPAAAPPAPIVAHDKSGKLWTKDPTTGQFKDDQGKVYKP